MKKWQHPFVWRHRFALALLLAVCAVSAATQFACSGPRARSENSFDEIRASVDSRTADEVARLLGEPDSRQVVFDDDERWIWWNYTYLDGNDYPPEKRGRVVHLEIVFKNPAKRGDPRSPYNQWKVDEALGVNFKVPSSDG